MSNPSKQLLFHVFPPINTETWEEKIREDLKGADYEKKLVWQTLEGFKVQPYYRKEHLEDKSHLITLPDKYPFIRGNKIDSNTWEIRQDIEIEEFESANRESLFIQDHGINSMGFRFSPIINNINQNELHRLINGIRFENIGVHFMGYSDPLALLNLFLKEIKAQNFDPKKITGSVDFDPLGFLTVSGAFRTNEASDFDTLAQAIQFASENLPDFRALVINGIFIHNAGSSVVQELAYSLAMGSDYLNVLTDSGISVDTISCQIQFNLGTGSNYFMEISKIRALRFLWTKIVEAYHPKQEDSMKAFVHSQTSGWNQTLYDPYMNVLRATTEAMAAVLGGTDSLTVLPFSAPYNKATPFAQRIARNIQIILDEEAYFGKVIDPSAGSYYIENLTDALIDEAWNLFLKIESEGGYLESLKKGIVQADIENISRKRTQSIATRCEILVGTNQYPNFEESVRNLIDEEIAFPEQSQVDTIIKPLLQSRGGIEFEQLRLATEKHLFRPVVFMLTFGDLAKRRARAMFSGNFFASAGYKIIDNPGFASVEEGMKSSLKEKAHIIVFCSSDEEYAILAPETLKLNINNAVLVVAGAPACIEQLKALGINNFIHLRSNVQETLKNFHKTLGIIL